MLGVELWAEIRRLYFVERCSKRAIHRLTGVHRDTITRAIESEVPPKYERAPAGSKLDPFKDWICEQLRADPTIQSLRLREMAAELGYEGGKTIFDDYVREVRPRFHVRRTFQRTLYRPGACARSPPTAPRRPHASPSPEPMLKRGSEPGRTHPTPRQMGHFSTGAGGSVFRRRPQRPSAARRPGC